MSGRGPARQTLLLPPCPWDPASTVCKPPYQQPPSLQASSRHHEALSLLGGGGKERVRGEGKKMHSDMVVSAHLTSRAILTEPACKLSKTLLSVLSKQQ